MSAASELGETRDWDRSLCFGGERSDSDQRTRPGSELTAQPATRRVIVGLAKPERGSPRNDSPVHRFQQCEIVLDFMNGPPVVDDMGIEMIVATVYDAFASCAALRESDDEASATAPGDVSGTIEISIPARHESKFEGAGSVVVAKCHRLGPGVGGYRESSLTLSLLIDPWQ